jgi:DNA (cytosine-5)-methyltransferase 1
MGSTKANVVEELKTFPEKLGILGTVLDAKILHLPVLTALAIARDFADDRLKEAMTQRSLALKGKGDAEARLNESDLARAFSGAGMGLRNPGPKIGPNTQEAFEKLVQIAASNDPLLNAALGRALKSAGLIQDFRTEQDLGTGLARRTDIACTVEERVIRLEVMWRAKTSRAEIANYALTKLYNYGRALGFLTTSD